MLDRGALRVGLRADINVIDHAAIAVERPSFVHDLPTGAGRWAQGTRGYKLTMLRGVVTFVDGRHTGAMPGGLVRRMAPPRGAGALPAHDLPVLQPEQYKPAIDLDGVHGGGGGDIDMAKHADDVMAATPLLGPSAQGRIEKDLQSKL